MSIGSTYQIVRRGSIRRPDLESTLIKSAGVAYLYARDVLHDRWQLAEPVILADAWVAACYARDVIRGRWIEAEPMILANPRAAAMYTLRILSLHPWQSAIMPVEILIPVTAVRQ